jgi:hypothetical protein
MTITLTREEAQQVLDAFVNWDARGRLRLIETLRARLAQHETPYEIGKRLYREGKGISFIATAVERDDQIGEALRGFEDARLAQPEPEPAKLLLIPALMEQAGWVRKREWIGLTDEEKSEIYNRNYNLYAHDMEIGDFFLIQQAVEAKLKEKNHG